MINLGGVLIFYLKVPIFFTYAILRVYGMYHPSMLRLLCQGTAVITNFLGPAGAWAKAVGIDCLALIACLLFPR
jgi:hypothetical protein